MVFIPFKECSSGIMAMLFFWNRDELELTSPPEMPLLQGKEKARPSDTHLTCKISWGNLGEYLLFLNSHHRKHVILAGRVIT